MASRIREVRLTFDITQEHLAQLLGVSWTSVSRWEQGRRRPTPASARLLAVLERACFDPDLVTRVRSPAIRDPLAVMRDVFEGILTKPPAPPRPAAGPRRPPARFE